MQAIAAGSQEVTGLTMQAAGEAVPSHPYIGHGGSGSEPASWSWGAETCLWAVPRKTLPSGQTNVALLPTAIVALVAT